MGKVVNLRQARKDRARQDKRAKGDQNAAKFGQTAVEKQLNSARADKARRDLDGHALPDTDTDPKA
ncbi:MAG: DUF4169 family protein [Pseudomonadota bacterium]|jgi:hypothetical protein|nr:DUF4169 family protein [Pseudomonadota bacterium]